MSKGVKHLYGYLLKLTYLKIYLKIYFKFNLNG